MVGSFDAGMGYVDLMLVVGEKAKEMWYLCHRYTAKEVLEMGLVNKVVSADKLEEEVDKWCNEILEKILAPLPVSKPALTLPLLICGESRKYYLGICGSITPLRRLSTGRNRFGRRRRNLTGRDLEERKYSPGFMRRRKNLQSNI